MNTISGPMLNRLPTALRSADEDAIIRAVIVTGTGRAFCAGLDLRGQISDEKTDTNITDGVASSTTINLNHTPPTVLHEMDTPAICALNGSAAGYGMGTFCTNVIY